MIATYRLVMAGVAKLNTVFTVSQTLFQLLAHIDSFNLHNDLGARCHGYSHFTDEEAEAHRLSILPKITQLASGRDRI